MQEIAKCNNFKWFVTMTINSSSCDRFSLDKCQEYFSKLTHNYSRRLKYLGLDFKYIFITEKHDKGGYHFHGLVTNLIDDDLFINDNGYLDSYYFSSKLGHFSCSKIKSQIRCANYIMKYISKDAVKNSHNQIYFCSKGLARAQVFDLAPELQDNSILSNFWRYENDYVKLRDFSFEKIPKNIQLFLMNKKDI